MKKSTLYLFASILLQTIAIGSVYTMIDSFGLDAWLWINAILIAGIFITAYCAGFEEMRGNVLDAIEKVKKEFEL